MYLRKKKGVYHWRRRVPEQLQQVLGKREIVKTLQTKDRTTAKQRAAILMLKTDDFFSHPNTPLDLTFDAIPEQEQTARLEVSQTVRKSVRLNRLVKLYVAARMSDGKWSEVTKTQTETTLKLFVKLVGDIGVDSLSRDRIRKYREALVKHGYSANTVSLHFKRVSSMIVWGKLEGWVTIGNPVTGLRPQEDDRTRVVYTPEDLKTLFASPLFTGHWRRDRRERAGKVLVKDYKYWFPLIALHSGMRLEEIAQLRKEDVLEVDGVLAFNIRQSKTASGIRTIPVHSRLLDLGFEDHLKKIKRGTLWPDTTPSPSGKRSGTFAKWWPFYLRSQKLKREGLVFHSFRHTFSSCLQKAGVPEDIAGVIMGHKNKSLTYGRYGGKLIGIPMMSGLIEDVDFGVSLNHLSHCD